MSTIDDLWVVGQLFQRAEVDDPTDGDGSLLHALLAEDRDAVEAFRVAGVPVGLREAALLGDAARVRRLLAAGVAPVPERGWSALHLAAWAGQTAAASALLDAGVPVDAQSSDQSCTALALAVVRGHRAMVALLLARGARPGSQDGAGWTPLHQAAESGDLTVVKQLLNAGAEVNPLCGDTTPLGLAEREGHPTVVALLRQLGGTD